MTGAAALVVEFCDEVFPVGAERPFVIGRDADLAVDENPYLHRRFLQIDWKDSLWWLANVGSQLTATVTDERGTMQARLAPSASMPLIFDRTLVWFTAGPTTYELEVRQEAPLFVPAMAEPASDGATTIGRTTFTPDQFLLIVALCEPFLRQGGRGMASVPSSADAATRVGWTITKFNRKLDNVCQKLSNRGVRGLHGGPEKLAVNRRARLVEYALSTCLVDRTDLELLDTV